MVAVGYVFNSLFVSLMGHLIGYRYLLETIYRYQSLYQNLTIKSFFVDWICHSDFPSLLSYSDFLSSKCVKHSIGYLVDKNDAKSPILLFVNEGDGYNCYILTHIDRWNVKGYDCKNMFFDKHRNVFDRFNPVYLEVEQNVLHNSIVYDRIIRFIKKVSLFIPVFLCLLIGLENGIVPFCFVNIFGLYVSCMIVSLRIARNEFGILNNICYLNKYFDCKRVMSSINNIYVEDLISFCSLSYFISNLFFVSDVISDYIVFLLVNGVSLILTSILLIRQFFSVRKLCLFCLLVALCVIFNVVIIYKNINYELSTIVLIRYIFLFVLCVILMYLILFVVNMANTYIIDKRKLNFYVKNKAIFNTLLPSLIRYDVLNVGFELRNKDSIGEISIIISLSCKYCYDMFKDFVFVFQNCCKFSYRIIVVVNQSCENIYRDLKDVYMRQDNDYFVKYLGGLMSNGVKCNSANILEMNSEFERIRSLQLERIPVILYNGYLLPSEYSLIDLCDLLE